MLNGIDKELAKLGYACSHAIMQGKITGVTPKKHRQKGFKGFACDAPKTITISKECVIIRDDLIELLDVFNIRSINKIPTGNVIWRNHKLKVERRLVQDPKMNANVVFKGIGRVWKVVNT